MTNEQVRRWFDNIPPVDDSKVVQGGATTISPSIAKGYSCKVRVWGLYNVVATGAR